MPSPKVNGFKILIRPTKWLEPVSSEPLEVPANIQPGQTVAVSGTLRAFIKHESTPRELGSTFCIEDTIGLVAYSERLERMLPEFYGPQPIVYRYPLIMSNPRYLDCVVKGEAVKFSWTVRIRGPKLSLLHKLILLNQMTNISRRAYGGGSALRRAGGTYASNANGMLKWASPTPESPGQVRHMIHILEPGASLPVTIYFTVSEWVNDFSRGDMIVNLMLSDPHLGGLQAITTFHLNIQVSPSYSYNPMSRFLLVFNASTSNSWILKTMAFLKDGLHLPADVFNLSLTGSFIVPRTQQNVCCSYIGKTIVIFSNTMNYFQHGTREPWDLLDAWEACLWAKHETNFLFLAPSSIQSLQEFAQLMSTRIPALVDGEVGVQVSDVIARLQRVSGPSDERLHSFPVKKVLFRSLEKTLLSKAKSTQKKTGKKFPLRRFLVAPCDLDLPLDPKAKRGAVAIVEGLSHSAKMVASIQPAENPSSTLSSYNIAMITHSLPFTDQCAIFWNLVGLQTAFGISTTVAYQGQKLAHLRRPRGDANGDDLIVHAKV